MRGNFFHNVSVQEATFSVVPNNVISLAVRTLIWILYNREYNKHMLKGKVPQVKEILSSFSYPYNRRIAGQHGHFTMEDYGDWLKKAETGNLAQALRRFAQLNQAKVYLFWKKHQS